VGFWPLILLLLVGIFLSVATFCILALAFRDNAPHRLHLVLAAAGLTAVASISLLVSTRLGVGIDQKALAKNIADDIRSVPLKVEIANNGHIATLDETRLAEAIAARLRAAPLDVQVTKEPPFDNAALAKAIAAQFPLRPPTLLMDSRTVEGISLVLLIISILLILPRWRDTEKPFLKDRAAVLGALSIVVALVAIITAHSWAPPSDSAQLVVTFDNIARGAEQVFFDASSKHPIHFTPADDTPPRDAVCAALQELNSRGSRVAIVVGSHDQLLLNSAASLRFSSNASLARRRAEAVRNILIQDEKPLCNSPRMDTVIALSDSPLNVGTQNRANIQLEEDRAVRIFGLATR